jgi:hypothetical protein
MLEPKVTRKDIEIDTNLTLDACADCKIPVLIEKDEKAQGRLTRCTSCFMKFKLRDKIK